LLLREGNRTLPPLPHLSPRENQICVLVVEGESNDEIAAALEISPGTVKEYLSQIFLKTGLKNRTVLAARYVQGASARKPTRANHPTKPRREKRGAGVKS
jgi:DNA-binding NarL/FixJ family response regulator